MTTAGAFIFICCGPKIPPIPSMHTFALRSDDLGEQRLWPSGHSHSQQQKTHRKQPALGVHVQEPCDKQRSEVANYVDEQQLVDQVCGLHGRGEKRRKGNAPKLVKARQICMTLLRRTFVSWQTQVLSSSSCAAAAAAAATSAT